MTRIRRYLLITTLSIIFLGIPFLPFLSPKSVLSVTSHVVISEIQIAGGSASDEFVELYNPTGDAVNITGWSLKRKPLDGDPETNITASLSGTLTPHGYFLIAKSPGYDGSVFPDVNYSSSIASNNTILLYSGTEVASLVDKVGMGDATDKEASAIANPLANGSVERKANSLSTPETMGPSGSDEQAGNGEDTDNNSADFIVRTVSDPQNSNSAIEPPIVPTPTATPTNTPSPTETPAPTPTDTPTPTPTETPSPTNTPTPTITPSPTVTPTITPTPTLIPTLTPQPTATPTPFTTTPTPTTSPSRVIFSQLNVTCQVKFIQLNNPWFAINFPKIVCTR